MFRTGLTFILLFSLVLPIQAQSRKKTINDASYRSAYTVALTSYKNQQFALSVRQLIPLAKKNYAPAMAQLAYMYEYGIGLPKNVTEANKLYKKLLINYLLIYYIY